MFCSTWIHPMRLIHALTSSSGASRGANSASSMQNDNYVAQSQRYRRKGRVCHKLRITCNWWISESERWLGIGVQSSLSLSLSVPSWEYNGSICAWLSYSIATNTLEAASHTVWLNRLAQNKKRGAIQQHTWRLNMLLTVVVLLVQRPITNLRSAYV